MKRRVCGDSPRRRCRCKSRFGRSYLSVSRTLSLDVVLCRPSLRVSNLKMRIQNPGSGAPIPSRSLHGNPAKPGQRSRSAGAVIRIDLPNRRQLRRAPKKARGRRSGTTIGGVSRKGNEYAAPRRSAWSAASEGLNPRPGGGKGEALRRRRQAHRDTQIQPTPCSVFAWSHDLLNCAQIHFLARTQAKRGSRRIARGTRRHTPDAEKFPYTGR